jgi:hypothetical protein
MAKIPKTLIDSDSPITPDQDLNLKAALQALRSGDDTPEITPNPPPRRGPKPKPKDPDPGEREQESTFMDPALRATAPATPEPPKVDPALIDIYNIEEYQVKDLIKEPIDNKEELTEREYKFIRLTHIDHVPPLIALVAAGYPKYQDRYAYDMARKIRKKYECLADGRQIFSDLNFGAVEIAQGIIDIAQTCQNVQVRLNALALAAKASGLLKEAVDQAPGVTIIIKTQDDDDAVGGREPVPYSPSSPSVAVQVNGPVALTK